MGLLLGGLVVIGLVILGVQASTSSKKKRR